jgi:hypothetical protein
MPTAVTKRPAWIFCSITLFAIVFGSIFLDRYNSFETSPRRAVIVDKFVSRRDTMVAASSSVVDPLHEWISDRFPYPAQGDTFRFEAGVVAVAPGITTQTRCLSTLLFQVTAHRRRGSAP